MEEGAPRASDESAAARFARLVRLARLTWPNQGGAAWTVLGGQQV